jgi:outer membrane protein TolC
VLLLLVASGCPVGPDYMRSDVRLNPISSEAGARLVQSEVDQAWWRGFDDPTLDRLIEIASQENLPLQIAGLRILDARATIGIAYGSFLSAESRTDRGRAG